MVKTKIVADSSSDILVLNHIPFTSSALKIITAEKEFADDILLDVEDMVTYGSRKKA